MALPVQNNNSDVPRKKRMSEKYLCYKYRCVTDIYGLILMITIVLMIWAKQLIYARSNIHCGHEPNRTTYIDSLINDVTPHILKAKNLISGFTNFQFEELVDIMLLLYFGIKFVVFLIKLSIACSKSDAEFSYHFKAYNIAIVLSASIFVVASFCDLGDKIRSMFQYLTYYTLFTNPPIFAAYRFTTRSFTSNRPERDMLLTGKTNAIWFYFRCRYLILFQFLTLMAMTLFTKYVIINWIYSDQSLVDIFITGASIFIVLFLHIYGKIIVITAAASHDWDKCESGVSFKGLCLAIAIVTRYHVGTIFLDAICIPANSVASNFTAFSKKIHAKNIRTHAIYSTPHAIELARIFTALLGQNRNETVKSVESLRKKDRLPAFSKSKLREAWALYFKYSLALLVSKATVVFIYLAVIAAIYYIITAVDTIKNTIQFCKTKEEEFLDKGKYTIIIVNEPEGIEQSL